MSVSSYGRPIRRIERVNSDRSLYTENSNDSNGSPKNDQKVKENKRVSEQINALTPMKNTSPDKKFTLSSPKRNNEEPTVPQYRPLQINQKNSNIPNRGGIKFNSHPIGMSSQFEGNKQKASFEQNPYRISGMSGISQIKLNDNDRSRMLRSSQGGRWLRSQSLMQEKDKKSGDFVLRNFHRNGSKYNTKIQQLLNLTKKVQKILSSSQIKHKISVEDSLQEMKNKMENYLESQIDLSNLPIDRPDAEWGQNQLIKFYQNYQPILLKKLQSQVNSEQVKNCPTVLKKYKNCSYFGPLKDGKKHGFGFLHYFSGRFFEGLFEGDQKVQGFEMDDSELYLGKYQKNQRNGQGILKNNEYLMYGVFTNGQFYLPNSKQIEHDLSLANKTHISTKNGFKIAFSNVTFFMNESILNKNQNGDVFIGDMNDEDEKHGEGLEIFANGDLYIGKYEQGAPEGYGQYYWDSGAFYRGEFLSGMRHGKGVWMMVNGDHYDGEYLNDKKNGKGVYTWKLGDKYVGNFQNDYRHGYGEMFWRDGKCYKGQWSNGIETNKVFQLEGQKVKVNSTKNMKHETIANPKSRVLPSVTKNSFKTVELKRRVGGNSLNSSSIKSGNRYPQQYHRVQSSKVNDQRIPLQKLKAMLNPSNSIN